MDIIKPSQSTWVRYRHYVVIGVLITLVLAYAFNSNFTKYRLDAKTTRIGEVEKGTMTVEVIGSGELAPKHAFTHVAKNGGIVRKVYVISGQKVMKGDKLLLLENDEIEKNLSQVKNEYAVSLAAKEAERFNVIQEATNHSLAFVQAESDLEMAKIQLEARQKLVDGKHLQVSKMEYALAVVTLKNARAKFDATKKVMEAYKQTQEAKFRELNTSMKYQADQLANAQRRYNELEITAQNDGVVQNINRNIGEHIKQDEAAAKIVDTSSLHAVIKVSAFDANKVEVGMSSDVMISGQVFKGTITNIHPEVKENVVTVHIEVKDILPGLKINSLVKATIEIGKRENVLYVARPNAVAEQHDAEVIVIEANGIAKRKKVTFGIASNSRIEIVKGLNLGEKIVLSDIESIPRDAQEIVFN